MPSGMTIPLTFKIYRQDAEQGEVLVRTETLSQDIIKIGKLSSSHLSIDDESVSRMHAVIETTGPGEVFILDLGSTKGTLVNGQKINKVKLQSGDTVQLGSTRIVVTVGAPQEEATEEATQVQAQTYPKSTQMGMPAMPSRPTPAPVMARPAVNPATIPAPFPAPVAAAPVPAPVAPRMPQPAMPAPSYQPPVGFDASAVEVQDGSRAIEVAAMFEDSVIDVRHFTDPAAGTVTSKTKTLLGVAALSLTTALVTFIVAYFQVAAMKARWDAWDAAGKPHNEFPVPHGGAVFDVIFTVCLVVGLYSLFYGLSRLFSEHAPRDFTIGQDGKALFNAPSDELPVGCFPLVHSTGADYELIFTASMNGDVTFNGSTIPLPQLVQSGQARPSATVASAFSWAIPNGARAKVDLGQNTFLVSSVPAPRHYPVPLAINWSQQSYTGVTALVVALFLGMIYSIPPDPKSLSLDAFMNDQRLAQFLIKPPEEKEEQIPDWLKKKGPDEAGGKGKRHKGEEGKMGKKESKNKTGLYGLKGPKDNTDPHLAKMLATEAAQNAGVLGLLKAQQGSHLASIFGRDSALGNDAENVLGGLVGTQIGEAYGVGGLGLVGSGTGGGGTGEGTIGLGGLGTIGKGGGGGSGSGYGRGAGGLGGRRAHAPDVVPGTAQVRGSLDKEIIRRVIRRHLNEVKFCYEKELLRNASLYGRVMIQFTISGFGKVVASVVQNSTVNNPTVEQCIAGAVRRWEFPAPQGGGIVMVSYPFVLKSAGGE